MLDLKRAGAVLALMCVSLTAPASPASAHDDGGVFQPIVGDFVIEGAASPTGRSVWIRVVDADSGAPAQGVAATASTGGGTSPLEEVGLGYFSGEVGLAPGRGSVTISLRSTPGGLLIRKFTRSWTVDVPPVGERKVVAGAGKAADLEAAEHSPVRTARAAAAEKGKNLALELEAVEDRTLASPLYVSLHAKVKVRATGALDPTEHGVYGWAVDESGATTEFVKFRPLDVVDPGYAAGTYGGVVILPHGGKWSMNADVLELQRSPSDPPIQILSGQLPVERTGPSLQRSGAAEDRLSAVRANLTNTIILALHSLAAAAWGAILAALALLAFQRGRALSPWARNALERHLDGLVRAAWFLAVAVYVTGVYNLYRESPYGVPSSVVEIQRLLRLPFARPYFLALAIKLAGYAVLLYGSTRLIAGAKATTRAPRSRSVQPITRTPWSHSGNSGGGGELVHAAQIAAPVSSPASALRGTSVREAPTRADPSTSTASDVGHSFRVLLPVMAACGGAIIVCVTILKTAHLLIEVARIRS
jgi:hypothetical protein